MSNAEKATITARAIAHRLSGRSLTGERLQQAIEEVADDMTSQGIAGSDKVAHQFLAEMNLDFELESFWWIRIVNKTKKLVTA